MFDVGFSEIVLIFVVALLVFGPERLPRVAREAALWLGKARRMVATVKSEIDQELQLQDLKESILEERRRLETADGIPRKKQIGSGGEGVIDLPTLSKEEAPDARGRVDEQ